MGFSSGSTQRGEFLILRPGEIRAEGALPPLPESLHLIQRPKVLHKGAYGVDGGILMPVSPNGIIVDGQTLYGGGESTSDKGHEHPGLKGIRGQAKAFPSLSLGQLIAIIDIFHAVLGLGFAKDVLFRYAQGLPILRHDFGLYKRRMHGPSGIDDIPGPSVPVDYPGPEYPGFHYRIPLLPLVGYTGDNDRIPGAMVLLPVQAVVSDLVRTETTQKQAEEGE